MADIVLLGPQRPTPNVRAALAGLAIEGPVCAITAGWHEREGELDELREHLGRPVTELALYARCEEAFAHDPGLFEAHRARQDTLIAMQRFYRVRLSHALAAVHELAAEEGPGAPLVASRRAATRALRALDRSHLRDIRRVHAEFEARCPASRCPRLGRHREAVARTVADAAAVLVAGGHVAVLAGRLRLLDLGSLLGGKTVVAWSAGAMALSERVVLFHDHPPQGAGDPEILDAGLGLVRGVVPLPSARERLALGDAHRVGVFARRFSPARALTLDNGALARWSGDRLVRASRVARLTAAGRLVAVTA